MPTSPEAAEAWAGALKWPGAPKMDLPAHRGSCPNIAAAAAAAVAAALNLERKQPERKVRALEKQPI